MEAAHALAIWSRRIPKLTLVNANILKINLKIKKASDLQVPVPNKVPNNSRLVCKNVVGSSLT